MHPRTAATKHYQILVSTQTQVSKERDDLKHRPGNKSS
jgi:hypothetical protein